MNLNGRLKKLEQIAEADEWTPYFIKVDTVLGVLCIPDCALPNLVKVYGSQHDNESH